LCSSLRMKPSSLRPPQRTLAGALQEDRGVLFLTTSVENKEPPLYIGHYPGTRTGTPTREARGCPLRAWEREGRVSTTTTSPYPDPHEPPSWLCRAPEALSRLVAGAARLVGGEQLSGGAASPLFGKGQCSVRDRSLHFVAHLGEANTIGDVPHVVNNGV
jgi:hypothetical protein